MLPELYIPLDSANSERLKHLPTELSRDALLLFTFQPSDDFIDCLATCDKSFN